MIRVGRTNDSASTVAHIGPHGRADSSFPLNVLLVEDNPADAHLIRELLRAVSASMFVIEWVDRLDLALSRLAEGNVDVVLTDLSLPDSHGLETALALQERAPKVPVVVLTAVDDDNVAVEAVHLGAQDYVIKGQTDGALLTRTLRYAVERKRAEGLEFLLRELDHRVKNTLATVQSMADLTLNSSSSLPDFAVAFRGRLGALTRLYEELSRTKSAGLDLDRLVELAVGAHEATSGQISASGDAVKISSNWVRSIGMALHELATNATRHGALTKAAGRVAVTWSVETTDTGRFLRIHWVESGGPAVATPLVRGSGTTLIEEAIAYETGGTVRMRFDPAGVTCEISIPVTGQVASAT